jgi:hypothetical protein
MRPDTLELRNQGDQNEKELSQMRLYQEERVTVKDSIAVLDCVPLVACASGGLLQLSTELGLRYCGRSGR